MIAELIASTRKLLAERRDRDERAAIAKAFNDRYTYRREYAESRTSLPGTSTCSDGYAWMCPTCNQVHRPLSICFLGGLQYPGCCGEFEGHRLSEGIRTS